jgi:hypothetical protein
MTGQRPAPEAVEAVARAFHIDKFPDHGQCDPNSVELMNAGRYLRLIRDAIHRDGDDADAIREELGLRIERAGVLPGRGDHGETLNPRRVRSEWQEDQR